jgi:alpha-mannosidase
MSKPSDILVNCDVARQIGAQQYLVERISAEIGFAEGLARLERRRDSGWARAIASARRIVREAVAGRQFERLHEAVEEAEAALAPIGPVAKAHIIHCVGHAHIDMNWMWSWHETVAVTNDTFTTLLKLMDEFPDFRFTQSQGAVYEIARQYNPAMFEEIRRRVKEGRWEIVAPHWVEGDKNLASGESLARHLLYTRQYMREHFDLEPEDVPIDWEPDTFGHAHTIPSIDARGAVKYYYCCRPGEQPTPPVFWWKGPDGSRLLVNREIDWYNNTIEPKNTAKLLEFRKATGLKEWMLVYGVGDHGGGPTRRDLRRAMDMNNWPIFPSFRFGTALDFFRMLEKEGEKWPTLDRELNFEFAGCYTTQTAIKKANRFGENAASEADAAAALAWAALGRAYPHNVLREAWKDVCFSHFHDILPGSGVRGTREYNQGTFQKVLASTGMVKTHSLRALAGAVDTSFASASEEPEEPPQRETTAMGSGAGRITEANMISAAAHVDRGPRVVVIFNPCAWERNEVVTATVWDVEPDVPAEVMKKRSFVARSSDGDAVPAQVLSSGTYWGHKYVELAFAASVGPMGWSSYALEQGEAKQDKPGATKKIEVEGGWKMNLPVGRVVLENEHLEVEFDRTSGGVVRLVEKSSGRNLATPERPLGVLEYVLERPGQLAAWILGDVQKRVAPLEAESFRTEMEGPLAVSAVSKVRINDSRMTVKYTLGAGSPMLEIEVNGTWLERGSDAIGIPRLAMQFPLALVGARPRYEIPFASIERDVHAGREVPSLRWADVRGRPAEGRNNRSATAGLALLNDSKYGHSLDGSTLRLTLIRSSYYPDPLPEMGEHAIRMAVVPHNGKVSVADLVRLGAGFNQPLQVVNADAHEGALPGRLEEGVTVEPEGVILAQVKKAEDVDGLVLRLYDVSGRSVQAKVTLAPELFGKVKEVTEVDLLERAIGRSSAKSLRSGFSVKVPAQGIASVLVKTSET